MKVSVPILHLYLQVINLLPGTSFTHLQIVTWYSVKLLFLYLALFISYHGFQNCPQNFIN